MTSTTLLKMLFLAVVVTPIITAATVEVIVRLVRSGREKTLLAGVMAWVVAMMALIAATGLGK